MNEHYCDCCGHVHGDLEVYEKVAQLEANREGLIDYGAKKESECAQLEANNNELRDFIDLLEKSYHFVDNASEGSPVAIAYDALKEGAE